MSKRFKPTCQHVAIFVDDLSGMNRFYRRHLGFRIEREFQADAQMMKDVFGIPSASRIVYLTRDGFGIELFKFRGVKLKKAVRAASGYNHWTLMVEDKIAFCDHLKKKGIPVIRVVKPHGYTFFIKDPEGNLIEIKSHILKKIEHGKSRY